MPTMNEAALTTKLDEARAHYADQRPRSREFHARAAAVMPGGNTRTAIYHGPFPLRIESGAGAVIRDLDGFEYVNMLGEFTAGLFGQSHPMIRRAIDAALDGGVSFGGHNLKEVEFAELITARFPAIEKIRFTNSGTEANLMAIATARYVTKRDKVLVFRGGYHGGLLYFVGSDLPINVPYELLVAPYNDLPEAMRLIREFGDDIACVLVEAMQGSAGCIPGDPDFLYGLQKGAKDAGALFILDEVMTSRFGRGGAHELFGLEPDVITIGKWVAGGMSFGAFGGNARIMDLYDPTQSSFLPHAGTFNNNMLSMSAGIAALETVFTPDVAESHHRRGETMRDRLNDMFKASRSRLQFTGIGSLMNLHATLADIRSTSDLSKSDDRIKELIFLGLLDRGFYIARRGLIALSLAVTPDQENQFVDAIADVIAENREVFVAD